MALAEGASGGAFARPNRAASRPEYARIVRQVTNRPAN